MTDTLYVSCCPLNGTHHWSSDPCATESVAVEALRTHLNGHSHGDLIGFAMTRVQIERYQRAEKESATYGPEVS